MREESLKSETGRWYAAIDLKSFFASVECVERNLDPLTTNLVVADTSRTEKTICLAVTPSLKAFGIPGRARLFEVVQKVKEINAQRLARAPGRCFTGESSNALELERDPSLALTFIAAPPRMAYYMKYSTEIYNIYLKYIAPEDTHVYSVDEVFMDFTDYLTVYGLTAEELAMKMVRDVLRRTGITATAGVGTNLYLCKIAMDIMAKHAEPDADGVRMAVLNEMTYRKALWDHRPLTDFWRIGQGYARKLEANGLYTMGDIARCSIGNKWEYYNEELLYKLFGINAELLIDHAWGWEPCTIADIHSYVPENNSLSSGQVLSKPYSFEGGRLIIREMAELLTLELVDKHLITDQMVISVGYDIENLTDPERSKAYKGPVKTDRYGRRVPKSAHGSINLGRHTSLGSIIVEKVVELYNQVADPNLLVRRVSIAANHVVPRGTVLKKDTEEQLSLFDDNQALEEERRQEEESLAREESVQETMLAIRKKFGKNAILKGMNLSEGATAMERNRQIGGHKA